MAATPSRTSRDHAPHEASRSGGSATELTESFPPLATTITGAARLVFVMLEASFTAAGGSYVFMDTDSVAVVTDFRHVERERGARRLSQRPDALPPEAVEAVVKRFAALNPYDFSGSILKIEDENYAVESGMRCQLYARAVSAKRYVLFNLDEQGEPVIRKHSEHGLGTYRTHTAMATRYWTEDLWRAILSSAVLLPIELDPEWWRVPAIGRLTITRPELLRPFEEHNRRHPDQAVRPHSFVSIAYPKLFVRTAEVRLFAPYASDPQASLEMEWYELRSSERVRITTEDPLGVVESGVIPVKSYGDVARAYGAHPERKFATTCGGPCLRTTIGPLNRRDVAGDRAEYISKEGNLLGQRVEAAGVAEQVQQRYTDPDDFREYVLPTLRALPRTELAEAAGISERALREILAGRPAPRPRTEGLLQAASRSFDRPSTPRGIARPASGVAPHARSTSMASLTVTSPAWSLFIISLISRGDTRPSTTSRFLRPMRSRKALSSAMT